jgi:hypothetical protein
MDDFASDTDSDYTSYWRDWVSALRFSLFTFHLSLFNFACLLVGGFWRGVLLGLVVGEACAGVCWNCNILRRENEAGSVMGLCRLGLVRSAALSEVK